MSFYAIRTAQPDDGQRLDDAARRFGDRHGLPVEDAADLDEMIRTNFRNASALAGLWRNCRCRALRVPVGRDAGIALGSVGYRHAH